MTDRNQKRIPMVYIPVLIILAALLISAGCSAPPVIPATPVPSPPLTTPATPEVSATCSADAGVCPVVIPASVRIDASPLRYSPLMSSTPGIQLTPIISGFNRGDAEFTWNTSYGQFLSWDSPEYTIKNLPRPVTNHGETIYWSFIDPPASTRDPVIISVTARNVTSGHVYGNSELSLGWEGNITVIRQDIR
jgi:hypothetical protein